MSVSGKKMLIQGAGRGHLGLVKTAKSMGVYTIITGMGDNYPCIPLADKNSFADIANPEAILEVAIREKVDGIVICCSDTGLRAVGRCCDVLNLVGIREESANYSSNKLLMKEKLVENRVQTALYYKIFNIGDLQAVVNMLCYPIIIKAIDLQGSRGIYIVKKQEELASAFESVMAQTKKDYCIVEEFIEGREFGAQAFVYENEILFILPHGDDTIMCQTAVPVGHYMPYEMNEILYQDVIKQATNAIHALGLNNCAVNIDFIERDNRAYVIELTGRAGANCLPELTSNYLGINYYEMIILMALGENPKELFVQRKKEPLATMAKMLFSQKSGIIKEIKIPQIEDGIVNLFVGKGDVVRSFTNSNDAIGEIIVKGKTLKECQVKLDEVESQIVIKYD